MNLTHRESLLQEIDTSKLNCHQQLKQINIQYLVIHYLRIVRLMLQKIGMIFIGVKINGKFFRRIKKSCSKNNKL